MKTDGYIFTPELLQWRYFHRPVVVQVLIHVLLGSAHNEAGAATLSIRDLAQQLHSTPKAVRIALDTLVSERIVTKCTSPRASTIVYVNSSHPLSHCIIPWQKPVVAQPWAQMGAQMSTQFGAQINTLQPSEQQGCAVYYQDGRGTDWGKLKGTDKAHVGAQRKTGAQRRAQNGAQIQNAESTINKEVTDNPTSTKGTDKDIAKGTVARKGKNENKETKEKTPPETPLKEKKERKERRQKSPLPLSQKKEKEKKAENLEKQLQEVKHLFNLLFSGTPVKTITRMTPERRQMVVKFIDDHGYEKIEPMFKQALASDLLMGRTDGRCSVSFDWLFKPKKNISLLEGTFDNPAPMDSAGVTKEKRQQQENSDKTPASTKETESLGERYMAAQKRTQATPEEDKEKERQKYLSFIDGASRDPNGSMAKMVRRAYEDGTLARLGIVWNPSAEEENQSLMELDDKTQDYLQSILED